MRFSHLFQFVSRLFTKKPPAPALQGIISIDLLRCDGASSREIVSFEKGTAEHQLKYVIGSLASSVFEDADAWTRADIVVTIQNGDKVVYERTLLSLTEKNSMRELGDFQKWFRQRAEASL